MTRSKGRLRIGTSGYQYDHWRGIYYPEGMPKKRWFERYTEDFDTVEINNTFYRLPERGAGRLSGRGDAFLRDSYAAAQFQPQSALHRSFCAVVHRP